MPAIRLAVLLLPLLFSSCARIHFDPGAGGETVYLQTIDHHRHMSVEHLRPAAEGPLVLEKNAWTVFWFLPLNHPDMGVWLRSALPAGAEPANLRASVRTPWYGYLVFFPTLTMVRVERVRYEVTPVRIHFSENAGSSSP